MPYKWVVCPEGRGVPYENGKPTGRIRNFVSNAVGLKQGTEGNGVIIWLIGTGETWLVPANEVDKLNVLETGDKYARKICNVCHCLYPVERFARNQNNVHGVVRRPSCMKCRTDIDKRAPKSSQARRMEKHRPAKGIPFKCPICQKRSIAGVTAKVVADHNHHTGNIRDFICDSCNTGLGRFKNGENYLLNAISYLRERDELHQ